MGSYETSNQGEAPTLFIAAALVLLGLCSSGAQAAMYPCPSDPTVWCYKAPAADSQDTSIRERAAAAQSELSRTERGDVSTDTSKTTLKPPTISQDIPIGASIGAAQNDTPDTITSLPLPEPFVRKIIAHYEHIHWRGFPLDGPIYSGSGVRIELKPKTETVTRHDKRRENFLLDDPRPPHSSCQPHWFLLGEIVSTNCDDVIGNWKNPLWWPWNIVWTGLFEGMFNIVDVVQLFRYPFYWHTEDIQIYPSTKDTARVAKEIREEIAKTLEILSQELHADMPGPEDEIQWSSTGYTLHSKLLNPFFKKAGIGGFEGMQQMVSAVMSLDYAKRFHQLTRKLTLPSRPAALTLPPPPPPPVQDPYEATSAFNARVENIRAEYRQACKEATEAHNQDVRFYNQQVRRYNMLVTEAQREAEKLVRQELPRLRKNAFLLAFGTPHIVVTIYNPDTQLFSVDVAGDAVSNQQAPFTLTLREPIPNAYAGAFDLELKRAAVTINLKLSAESIKLEKAFLTVGGRTYTALPSQERTYALARASLEDLSKNASVAVVAPMESIQQVASVPIAATPLTFSSNPTIRKEEEELEQLQKEKATQEEIAVMKQRIDRLKKEVAEKAGEEREYHSDVDAPTFTPQPERSQDFAMVVGVENYQNKNYPHADFAVRDAKTVAKYFHALGVPQENLKLLTGEEATNAKIKSTLKWLSRNVEANSRVYFYFSGHGSPEPATQRAYLLPWDGSPEDLEDTAEPVSALYSELAKMKSKQVLVALDACFSGQGVRSVIKAGARPLVTQVKGIAPSEDITAIAAARGNQIANSLDKEGHGLMTYYFLKGLDEGKKDAHALCEYLKAKVKKEAARQDEEQEPICLGPDFRF